MADQSIRRVRTTEDNVRAIHDHRRGNSTLLRTFSQRDEPWHLTLEDGDTDWQVNVESQDDAEKIAPADSTDSRDGKTVVSFTHADPENPYNWSSVCPCRSEHSLYCRI